MIRKADTMEPPAGEPYSLSPPQPPPRKKPWWRRKNVLLTVAGVLIFFWFVSLFSGDDDTATETAATPTSVQATPTPSPEPEEPDVTATETTEVEASETSSSPPRRSATPQEPAPEEMPADGAPQATGDEDEAEADEQEWDPDTARAALLDDLYDANGGRTIEESCSTDMLIEGTWFQCYYEDVEFVNPSQIRVTLSTPGDVDGDAIGASARSWFANNLGAMGSSDDYPDLDSVYTRVNGRDSFQTGDW